MLHRQYWTEYMKRLGMCIESGTKSVPPTKSAILSLSMLFSWFFMDKIILLAYLPQKISDMPMVSMVNIY